MSRDGEVRRRRQQLPRLPLAAPRRSPSTRGQAPRVGESPAAATQAVTQSPAASSPPARDDVPATRERGQGGGVTRWTGGAFPLPPSSTTHRNSETEYTPRVTIVRRNHGCVSRHHPHGSTRWPEWEARAPAAPRFTERAGHGTVLRAWAATRRRTRACCGGRGRVRRPRARRPLCGGLCADFARGRAPRGARFHAAAHGASTRTRPPSPPCCSRPERRRCVGRVRAQPRGHTKEAARPQQQVGPRRAGHGGPRPRCLRGRRDPCARAGRLVSGAAAWGRKRSVGDTPAAAAAARSPT